MSDPVKFVLPESRAAQELVQHPGRPAVALPPVLHPGTGQPIGPADLAPLFPMALIMQEVSSERYIEIPGARARDLPALSADRRCIRAHRLEKALDTPAHIYYKYEGVSPVGSHKPNTAIAQVYYNKQEGVKRIATETGAGQWGSALAMACKFFGIECKVYMVKVSYNQKPYRRIMMETFGANVRRQPQHRHQRRARDPGQGPRLARQPGHRHQRSRRGRGHARHQVLRSARVLNHVLLHQTVIGQEAMKQMEKAGEYPDVVIGCVGGGSNFAGIAFPFIARQDGGQGRLRFVAVEPEACPTLTAGVYAYDYGDTAKMTPVVKMYTLGHDFMPSGIHAGGLRYHGMSPLISLLYDQKLIEAVAPCTRTRTSRRRCSSPAPRASSRRPNRRTPSASPSTRRCAASERVAERPSSST